MRLNRAVVAACGAATVFAALPLAQLRVRPVDLEDGSVALALVLRQLTTTGVFMQATAHPDDESNALHVLLSRGQGIRTILATATRGDGGQNEIGPELHDPLAVLRTEELETMHRFDATEQYFTRAVDFGYSFSVEETFEKWGRDEIVADYVRLIRMTQPDVILGMRPVGTGGGLHHQASALLSREAFKAAGDPSRYPDQLRDGLMAWQPRKYYYPEDKEIQGALNAAAIDLSGFDPLLGRTYVEVGTEERGMHKSQAMAPLLALPAERGPDRYLLMDTSVGAGQGTETSLFTGIDTSLAGLASFAGQQPAAALVTGLAAIANHVASAQKQLDLGGPFATAPALVDALGAVRTLRGNLASMSLSTAARFIIDARLKTKEEQLVEGILLSHGLRIEALANDGIVVPGQDLRVSISIGDRGRPVTVSAVGLPGFDGQGTCAPATIEVGRVYRCDAVVKIPPDAEPSRPYWKRLPDAARYEFEPGAPFGLPFKPTPFRASIRLLASGASVTIDRPIEFRYQGASLEGEKRMELTVVPHLAVRAGPSIAIVPAQSVSGAAVDREVRVTVTNHGRQGTKGDVALTTPPGWTVTPPSLPLTFTSEDEAQTVRFAVRPPASTAPGDYTVRAVASSEGRQHDRGYQVVEYAHIRRRQLEVPATVSAKVMDVRVPAGLRVGYVMGTGDEVPAALRGLGAAVELLDADDLAWGDLNRFHAVVVGVRAYDGREDLRANNKRILDYASAGGSVIVQYNRNSEWTRYAPFPARFSSTRVTDENGEVQVLAADDPVLHFPNEIGQAAWRGWVQERGTYFIEPNDTRYSDVIQIYEPFPNNAGWKRGALVTTRVGKGHWTFVGLGLWRQVAAGTDGAYVLLANLVSRSRLPGSPAR